MHGKCEECEKEFIQLSNGRKRFCSVKCRSKHNAVKLQESRQKYLDANPEWKKNWQREYMREYYLKNNVREYMKLYQREYRKKKKEAALAP